MKIVITCFLIVSSSFSFGQISIINLSLTDSSLDIAYVGVDNHIALKGVNRLSTLIISVTNGTIEKYASNEYLFRMQNTDTSVFSVKQNGKVIASKTFKGSTLPSPVAGLGNLKDSVVTMKQIELNPFLAIILPNCFYRNNSTILGFSAAFFNHETNDSLFTSADRNKLSPQQLKIIKELKSGDTIYFDNIRYVWPDSRTVKASPFRIYIK